MSPVSLVQSDSFCLDIEVIIKEILEVRRFCKNSEKKPHKLLAIMTVFDLIEDKFILDGRVRYNSNFVSVYKKYHELFASANDRCRPYIPFFHLRSFSWWKLVPRPGKEMSFLEMNTCHSRKELLEVVDHAVIQQNIFEFFIDDNYRNKMRNAITKELKIKRSDIK